MVVRFHISFGVLALLAASGTVYSASSRPIIPVYSAAELSRACTLGLAQARKQVRHMERVSLAKARTGFLTLWDRLAIARDDIENTGDLVTNVSPDEKTRAAADACLIEANRFDTDLLQNEKIYERVKAFKPTTDFAAKLQKDVRDAFEDTGVALPPDQRARVKAILDRLEAVRQEFGHDLRDNKTRVAFTAEEMKGMPQTYLDKAGRDEKGNYLLGFAYPEYEPFMFNAENEDARRRYQFAFSNRGTPRNIELLAEAMRLRKEMAGLFGLPSYAHFALRHRMASTPEAVDAFLGSVKSAVRELERSEVGELTTLKAQAQGKKPEEVRFYRWDAPYYQNKVKQERYSIDQEALRKYFPTDASVKWIMSISSTLYGIRFVPARVPLWQEDVQYYDVVDADSGKFLSGIYLDLFPRPGKYTHNAAFPVRASGRLARRTPISVLVTNFNRSGLTHDELETLVHEFGHLMHGVLSDTFYAAQGGTSVERDFVEAPSQMYEEWARRMESLSQLKQFCSGDCPAVDEALIRRLEAARHFGAGIKYARQHIYAAFDMALSGEALVDPLETWAKMEDETPLGHVPDTQFPGTFEHIISGYTAGYYGYMWSEVLALDMLSAYGGNLMDPAVGRRFRTAILAQGSQKKAARMVRDFLGREPSNEAFFAEITGKRNQTPAKGVN